MHTCSNGLLFLSSSTVIIAPGYTVTNHSKPPEKQTIMTIEQIASRLAEYCRKEEFSVAQKELYANEAVSIEPYVIPGFEKETRGLAALMEKDRKFSAMVESRYGTTVSEPVIAGNAFAFVLTMDLRINGRDREKMTELCVYQVKDGKIISEQFFS
jgi:hypothetical protein